MQKLSGGFKPRTTVIMGRPLKWDVLLRALYLHLIFLIFFGPTPHNTGADATEPLDSVIRKASQLGETTTRLYEGD